MLKKKGAFSESRAPLPGDKGRTDILDRRNKKGQWKEWWRIMTHLKNGFKYGKYTMLGYHSQAQSNIVSMQCWVTTHKHRQNLVSESEVMFPVNQGIWTICIRRLQSGKDLRISWSFIWKKDFHIKASKAEQVCHQLNSWCHLHSLISFEE